MTLAALRTAHASAADRSLDLARSGTRSRITASGSGAITLHAGEMPSCSASASWWSCRQWCLQAERLVGLGPRRDEAVADAAAPRHKVPPVAADLPEVRCKPLDRARGGGIQGRVVLHRISAGNENRAACAGLRACRLAGAGTGDSSWLCDWDLSAGRHRAGVRAGVRRSCRRRRVAGILHPQCLRGWTGQYARTLLVAAALGAGAACQALFGALLVRRSPGYPSSLSHVGDALRFVLRGGALACLVGATFGVSSLWLAGRIPLAAYGINWFTRWLGIRSASLSQDHSRGHWSARRRVSGEPAGQSLVPALLVTLAVVVGVFFPCGCERTAEYRP